MSNLRPTCASTSAPALPWTQPPAAPAGEYMPHQAPQDGTSLSETDPHLPEGRVPLGLGVAVRVGATVGDGVGAAVVGGALGDGGGAGRVVGADDGLAPRS